MHTHAKMTRFHVRSYTVQGLRRAVPAMGPMHDGSWPPSPQAMAPPTTHVWPPQSGVRSAAD